jgi:LysR family nitrogen assimilation transcriptional regulator
LDYRKLRYFCTVANEGSLHKAAEKLHLSQPALTRAIQDLEAELDVRLFTRHARGVTLTGEGRVLLDHAHGLLLQADAARDAVRAAAAIPRGTVSIGVPPSLSVPLMVPLSTRTAATWPQVQLNMHERLMPDLIAMLGSDLLDAAVVGNPPPSAGVTRWGDEGEHTLILEPLDFISVPPGVTRSFTNISNEVARLFVLIQPPPEIQEDRVAYAPKVGRDLAAEYGPEVVDKLKTIELKFNAGEEEPA